MLLSLTVEDFIASQAVILAGGHRFTAKVHSFMSVSRNHFGDSEGHMVDKAVYERFMNEL